MKNTAIIFLLSVMLSHYNPGVQAQKLRTIFNAGFGTYQLNSYKNFQKNLVDRGIPFEGIKPVDRFPNYYNWMVAQEYLLSPYHSVSIELTYLYTGGRNHLADYSGQYALDMLASSYRFGLSYSNYNNGMFVENRLSGFLRFRAGVTRSFFNISEEVKIYDIHQEAWEQDFVSNSFYLEFGPGLVYELTPYISLHFSVGYEYEHDASLKSTKNKDETLISQEGGYVKTNWSGIRLRAGLGLNITKLIKTKTKNLRHE